MSILTAEYDVEIAKRVYAEEQVEKKMIELAKKLLKRGISAIPIAEDTGLSESFIRELQVELAE